MKDTKTHLNCHDLMPVPTCDTKNLVPLGPITEEIDFYGDRIKVLCLDDGRFQVVMKPIVEALGMSWGSQYNRLMRSAVLREGIFMMNIPLNKSGNVQETVTLSVDLLHGWLFTIDVERVKPQLRAKLIAYQRECYKVLSDYFTKGYAVNEQRTQQHLENREASFDLIEVAYSVIVRAAGDMPVRERPAFLEETMRLLQRIHNADYVLDDRRARPRTDDQVALLARVLGTGVKANLAELKALARVVNPAPVLNAMRERGYPVIRCSDEGASRYTTLRLEYA